MFPWNIGNNRKEDHPYLSQITRRNLKITKKLYFQQAQVDLETQAKLETAALVASQTRERARNNKKQGQVVYENVRFILDISSNKSCTFSVVFPPFISVCFSYLRSVS